MATAILAASYMVAEVVGGLITNSLALLADAGHMFSDTAALGLGLFAVWLAERPATSRRTYGYYRTEILAALANGAALVAVSLYIFAEAYHRLRQPPEVQGAAMMWIAVGGLGVNLLGLWILSGGRDTNLNVRGAWLHVLTDTLGSIGAIAAGGLIWAFRWYLADPLISALIGLLVVYSAWQLVAESVSVLMESAPRGIDVDEVRNAMAEIARRGRSPRSPRVDDHQRAGFALGPRDHGSVRRCGPAAEKPADDAPRAVRHRSSDHPGRAGGFSRAGNPRVTPGRLSSHFPCQRKWACPLWLASRLATRTASSRLLVLALACQARSKAVPWATLVRMIGSPSVTFTARCMPNSFSAMCPWSWYMATTASNWPSRARTIKVSAGSGPST